MQSSKSSAIHTALLVIDAKTKKFTKEGLQIHLLGYFSAPTARSSRTAVSRVDEEVPNITLSKMDSCVAVEKEIDRVINKFTAINEHSSQVIGDVVNHIMALKSHLEEGKLDWLDPV